MAVETVEHVDQVERVERTERLRDFGKALDAIRARVRSDMGQYDVDYITRLDAFSGKMERVGRTLIYASVEPVGFSVGVFCLWIHKQLQATEIGHTALHGAYDRLEGTERFHSKTFEWDVPIDEASWRRGHNIDHHQYTNITGKDPDIHFGFVRLTDHTPHRLENYWQLPFTLLLAFPNFAWMMNMHFTGMIDLYRGNGLETDLDFLKDRSLQTTLDVHKRLLRKFVPYYAKNFLFYPLLAGPMFLKVLLGNWLAETMRDVYTAVTIYCGHVGEETATYEEGTRASGRGEWYAMQIEASNNFDVSLPISILCGGLDLQIEHHIFPKLPPHRLRQVSRKVQETCEEYDVEYRTGSWGRTLRRAVKKIARLSLKGRGGPARRFQNAISVMA